MSCFNSHSTNPDAAGSQILIQAEALIIESGCSYIQFTTQDRSFVEQTTVLNMPICLCALIDIQELGAGVHDRSR
jgi:hypothetical protein